LNTSNQKTTTQNTSIMTPREETRPSTSVPVKEPGEPYNDSAIATRANAVLDTLIALTSPYFQPKKNQNP
jgi:hypothetical protein